MPKLTATNFEVIKPGVYTARIASITERNDAQFGPALIWAFDVRTKRGPIRVETMSSQSFGPKAKARQWTEAILGRKLQAGEEIELNDLVGKECQVVLAVKETDAGNQVNRVESVQPINTDEDDDILS